MQQTLTCPQCGKLIEIAEALQHEIEEKVLIVEREKHKMQLEEERKKAELEAGRKIRESVDFQIKSITEELTEERQRNKKFQEDMLELTKQLRQVRQEGEKARLEMEKQLAAEEERIRKDARKQVEEEQTLKLREKDKQLTDAQRKIDELSQKLAQGSQQMQGEVLELELEDILRKEFPNDEILPVPKGIRGADVVQRVVDRRGQVCGSILWESKNAKWSEAWIAKLKDDQLQVKSDIAVLVAVHLPDDVHLFRYRSGVWVTGRSAVLELASALRIGLYQVFTTRQAAVGKEEKMEILYQYLTGTEFRQKVEAIMEGFTVMQHELEREKNWFMNKWARQEKEIRKVLNQTVTLHGDLKGIIGAALPDMKTLQEPGVSETDKQGKIL